MSKKGNSLIKDRVILTRKENRLTFHRIESKEKLERVLSFFGPTGYRKQKRLTNWNGSLDRFSNTRPLCSFQIAQIIAGHKNHTVLEIFPDNVCPCFRFAKHKGYVWLTIIRDCNHNLKKILSYKLKKFDMLIKLYFVLTNVTICSPLIYGKALIYTLWL